MQRYLFYSLLGTLLLSLCGLRLEAQALNTAIEAASLSPSNPPSLLLVIVVDDSSTMNSRGGSLSSIETAFGNDANRRDVTDNNNERWRYVGRLLTTLHADTRTTHEVAVMSFDENINAWYSGTANNPFITIGSEGNGSAFQALMQRVTNPQQGEKPGDTLEAMEEVNRQLQGWLQRNGASTILKPVVLLITDDVPIRTWADSPWQRTTSWDTQINQPYRQALGNMQNLIQYTGTFCRHNNGKGILYTVAMGAANWVNNEGTVNRQGNGNYFQQVALQNNFVRLDPVTGIEQRSSQSTLVYPIDPQLSNTGLPLDDLRKAVDDFLREIRCLDSLSLVSDSRLSTTSQLVFQPFTIAPFVSSFQLIFDEAQTTTIQITAPDGEVVTSSTEGKKLITGERYQTWTFDINWWRAANKKWSGDWTISIQNGRNAAVSMFYSIDASGLTWRLAEALTENSRAIRIEFLQGGRVITFPDTVNPAYPNLNFVSALVGELRDVRRSDDTTQSLTVALQRSENTYLANVAGDSVFEFEPYIVLARAIAGTGLASGSIIALGDNPTGGNQAVRIDRSVQPVTLLIQNPPQNSTITCDANGNLSFNVVIGSGPLAEANPRLLERLYSYVEVRVFHRFANQAPEDAQLLISLPGNLIVRAFSTTINCRLLDERPLLLAENGTPIPEQIFEYRPVSNANIALPDPESAEFVYLTRTPTPTPTITPTPLIIIVPTQPAVNPMQEVGEVVLQPPGNILFGIGALISALLLLISITRSYVTQRLPLRLVWLERFEAPDGRTWELQQTQPIVGGLGRFLPRDKARVKIRFDGKAKTVFEIRATPERITGYTYVPLQIGPERIQPEEHFELYGEESLIQLRDEFSNYRFKIIDYDSKRVSADDWNR